MRIMIRSYSEKCQVHDVESAADTRDIFISYFTQFCRSTAILQHLDHDIIGTCHDFNEY